MSFMAHRPSTLPSGHSPGSVVFVWRKKPEDIEPAGFAVVGDVLFQGSVGRTDLPMGSHEQLLRSIEKNLLPLPDDTIFICGHGPMSTMRDHGDEERDQVGERDGRRQRVLGHVSTLPVALAAAYRGGP